jgi:hypothetical protein
MFRHDSLGTSNVSVTHPLNQPHALQSITMWQVDDHRPSRVADMNMRRPVFSRRKEYRNAKSMDAKYRRHGDIILA